jgi:hypothetical protein
MASAVEAVGSTSAEQNREEGGAGRGQEEVPVYQECKNVLGEELAKETDERAQGR